jgi:small subunit ribosomal protein S4
LSRDDEALSGRMLALPVREDVDVAINEQLIVEYYSR